MNLRTHLERFRADHGLPALAGIVVNHTTILAAEAVGLRHIGLPTHITLSDYFQTGSNAKALTATVCAILVEKGSLKWNTTPADLFPELAGSILFPYRRITLRHILRHRSGLPAYTDTDSPDFILPDFDGVPIQAHIHYFATWLIQNCTPLHPPDNEFAYSNAGYSLAAAMAERVTGSSWNTLVHNLVLTPLEIQGYIGINHPARISPNQPWGHLLENGIYTPLAPTETIIPPCLAPAGDVCISLPDYACFLQLHLNGLQGRNNLMPAVLTRYLHNDGQPGQGMGWGVNSLRGMEVLGRWSLHAGSTGTFFMIAAISHEHDIAFALVTNAGVPELTSVLKHIISTWFA